MAKKTDGQIQVEKIVKETTQIHIIGTSPLIMNRMSKKAREEIILPKSGRSKTHKEAKHNPRKEYQDSPYIITDEEAPALFGFPASGFKGAMGTAAIDLEGITKTQINRYIYVESDLIPIFGVTELKMDIVRMANAARTPDVRTRAIFPEWACVLNVSYVPNVIKLPSVLNLLSAAGVVCGIGDYRQEKGKGNYGTFRITTEEDAEFQRIITEQGRAVQKEGLLNPACYDHETQELFEWVEEELVTRGYVKAV